MARTIVKRESAVVEKSSSDGVGQDKLPMQGGTSGQPDDPNIKSTHLHSSADVAPFTKRGPDVPVKRFRVTGGPPSVMYAGQSCPMKVGKIVSEASVDIELLRRQHVQ